MRISRLLLILLLVLCPAYLNGQEFLFRITNQQESAFAAVDSITISTLLEQGYKLQKVTPDSALPYYRSALNKCMASNLLSQKARVFNYFASYYVDKKDYYTAIEYGQQSIKAALRQGQYPVKQYCSLTGLYTLVGAYDQSVALYQESRHCPLHNVADSYFYYRMICNVAFAYWEKGNIDATSKLYYYIIETASAVDTNRYAITSAYTGIANILIRLEQWDKAWAFLDKATTSAERSGDSVQIISMLGNKGTVYYQQKNYSKAKEYHDQALQYARRKKNADLIYKSTYIIGAILAKEHKYKEAQQYAKEAYTVATQDGMTAQWLSASYLMGCVHTHTGQYRIAKKYLIPAVKYAEEYKSLASIGDGYDHLSTIYAGLGMYKKALAYKEKEFRLQDSIAGKESAGRMAEVEMKYKTEKKDKLIAQKELLLISQRGRIREKNIWIGSLGAGGLLLTIVLVSLYTRKQHKEKLHRAYILNMEKDREIMTLKAKMEGEEEERARLARDLHDGVVVMFSAVKMNLSVLPEQHNSLEGAADFQKIIHRLDEATTELRSTAHNLLPDTLLAGGLTEAIYYFCKDIQQSSGLDIDQQYTDIPRFQAGFELSLYRIVQEIMQNVLKHAAATKALVQMIYDGNLLNITIEDNGKGFDTASQIEQEGIGIKNLRSRIVSLKGYLDIRSSPDKGTSIYMEFIPPSRVA